MGTARTRWATGVGIAVLSVGIGSPALASGGDSYRVGDVERVEMRDECDPATFNAPPPAGVGPGTCDGRAGGDVTLGELLEELEEDPGNVLRKRDAKGWKFSRDVLDLDEGDRVRVVNIGGEFHSFTPVPAFGAGCVPQLNAFFIGFRGFPPQSATEQGLPGFCLDPAIGGTFAPPGGEVSVEGLEPGTHRFECVIHPWMRTTVHVH